MALLPKFFISNRNQNVNKQNPIIKKKIDYKKINNKKNKSIVSNREELDAKAREIILSAKDEAIKIREQAVQETKEKLASLQRDQDVLEKNQRDLLVRQEEIVKRKEDLENLKTRLSKKEKDLEDEINKFSDKLEKVSSLSREEAKKILLEETKSKIQGQLAKLIKDLEDEATTNADEKVQDILVDAMRMGATDYVAEFTVSTVPLPSEDVKAKIIGKEGRNIRSFETKSGVDVDMDETPGMVRLSCFDSVRREIARVALTRLIKDGRIQPSRIEEYLEKSRQEIERVMYKEGEKLCHMVGSYNLPREVIAKLGRFKYRSSYGQNMITHTLEETRIGIYLAHELKANVDTVRLGCLLHDIGKVIDETEGSHVESGVKFLKKYNLPQAVIDAVAQHHEDEEFSSNESIIVYIADAISGARPGARRENYEEYIKRIKRLEEIAKGYSEVDEAFAIQAGREVRVVVNSSKADDDRCVTLATEIRDQIQDNLTYPGTVKINVIRETRSSAVAK
jgi:ribonucrease Y